MIAMECCFLPRAWRRTGTLGSREAGRNAGLAIHAVTPLCQLPRLPMPSHARGCVCNLHAGMAHLRRGCGGQGEHLLKRSDLNRALLNAAQVVHS